MPPEFSLTQDALDDQRQVVAVAGEIDLFTAPELKAAIGEALESGRTRIVVDLTATTFLDSTALGVPLANRIEARLQRAHEVRHRSRLLLLGRLDGDLLAGGLSLDESEHLLAVGVAVLLGLELAGERVHELLGDVELAIGGADLAVARDVVDGVGIDDLV